jgi:hypothetical protein
MMELLQRQQKSVWDFSNTIPSMALDYKSMHVYK